MSQLLFFSYNRGSSKSGWLVGLIDIASNIHYPALYFADCLLLSSSWMYMQENKISQKEKERTTSN